jgi:hypothetical protein
VLAAFPAGIAIALGADADPTFVIVAGLIAFGVISALNSAVHSYLILAYADGDRVAMNVGFYYMARACRRAVGVGRVRACCGADLAAAAVAQDGAAGSSAGSEG